MAKPSQTGLVLDSLVAVEHYFVRRSRARRTQNGQPRMAPDSFLENALAFSYPTLDSRQTHIWTRFRVIETQSLTRVSSFCGYVAVLFAGGLAGRTGAAPKNRVVSRGQGGEPLRQTPTGVPTAIRCRLSGLKRTSLFPASRMSVVDPKPSFRMRHGRNGYSQPRFHCLLPGVTKRSLVWGNRAPERVATPGARQRPPPDAENNGGEVS